MTGESRHVSWILGRSHSSKVLSSYARTCAGNLHRTSIHVNAGVSTSHDNIWTPISQRNITCSGEGTGEDNEDDDRCRTPKQLERNSDWIRYTLTRYSVENRSTNEASVYPI